MATPRPGAAEGPAPSPLSNRRHVRGGDPSFYWTVLTLINACGTRGLVRPSACAGGTAPAVPSVDWSLGGRGLPPPAWRLGEIPVSQGRGSGSGWRAVRTALARSSSGQPGPARHSTAQLGSAWLSPVNPARLSPAQLGSAWPGLPPLRAAGSQARLPWRPPFPAGVGRAAPAGSAVAVPGQTTAEALRRGVLEKRGTATLRGRQVPKAAAKSLGNIICSDSLLKSGIKCISVVSDKPRQTCH